MLFLPLLLLLLARDANGVISGPKFSREKGLLEPRVMEIPEEEVVAREGPQLVAARSGRGGVHRHLACIELAASRCTTRDRKPCGVNEINHRLCRLYTIYGLILARAQGVR